MDINVTIYETRNIASGFIVCNIMAPNKKQFYDNGFDDNHSPVGYNKDKVGPILATQNLPAPISATGILLTGLLGLPAVPYVFVEIMISPDGTRDNGQFLNITGLVNTPNQVTKINDPLQDPEVLITTAPLVHYKISI